MLACIETDVHNESQVKKKYMHARRIVVKKKICSHITNIVLMVFQKEQE